MSGDVADVLARRRHLDSRDRLENDRVRLADRILECALAGAMNATSFESTGWCLPSYTITRTSSSGIARDRALDEHLVDAFLDRGDVLARNRAADDFVDELEAGAARQRLDPQVHLAELAGAAGLLLVAVVAFGFAAYGLAVRDFRRPRRDVDPELGCMRSSITRKCSSPMPRSTVSLTWRCARP